MKWRVLICDTYLITIGWFQDSQQRWRNIIFEWLLTRQQYVGRFSSRGGRRWIIQSGFSEIFVIQWYTWYGWPTLVHEIMANRTPIWNPHKVSYRIRFKWKWTETWIVQRCFQPKSRQVIIGGNMDWFGAIRVVIAVQRAACIPVPPTLSAL